MESQSIDKPISLFRTIDWVTITLYVLLVSAGVISIYAASYDFDNASIFSLSEFSGKQALWIGLSLILGIIILQIDYRIFETYAYPVYIGVILLLIATIFLAPDIKGSRSWLVFGPVSLQPAEFGKFATALALAKLFSGYNFSLNAKISNYFRALIIIFLPISLILMQKETGSALVYISLIFVLYREGMSGLVLLSVLSAISWFVVTVKYATPIVMGIPLGQAIVLAALMVIFLIMIFLYCKNPVLGRNLTLAYGASALIIWGLSALGINIPGMVYFMVMLGGGIIYTAVVMFRHHIGKYLVSIGFVVSSVIFMFSVNYVFTNVLGNHQQMRIKVALGIEDNLKCQPKQNSDRFRRSDPQRIPERDTDKAKICTRATHRFHILHHRRGTWFHRLCHSPASISSTDSTASAYCRTTTHHIWQGVCLLRTILSDIPPMYKHRHGYRAMPGDRHSAAILQLRRLCPLGIHHPPFHPSENRCRQTSDKRLTYNTSSRTIHCF